MSLASQIIQGSRVAFNIIKNYLANPSISFYAGYNPLQPKLSGPPLLFPDPIVTVPLQCEIYREVMDADVSQQLIVSTNGDKSFITDNIAPKPRVWEIKGYIGIAPYELIAAPVLQILQEQRLSYLRQMYKSRAMLVFKTKNSQEVVFVGMPNLQIDSRPDTQNRIPFQMTVREIPFLEFANGNFAIPAGTNSAFGLGQALGTVNAVSSIAEAATIPALGTLGLI